VVAGSARWRWLNEAVDAQVACDRDCLSVSDRVGLEVRAPFEDRGAQREIASGHRFEGGTGYLDSVTLESSLQACLDGARNFASLEQASDCRK
jgi:hypothetical protein